MGNRETLTRQNAAQIRATGGTRFDDLDDFDEEVRAASAASTTDVDPAQAAEHLEKIPELSRPAISLLDRAIATTIKNRGQNLNDPNAKSRLEAQSDLLAAVNGNIGIALMAIMESPTPDDISGVNRRPNRVFSLLYGVMRSVTFLANNAYRRAINPMPGVAVADARTEPMAPWGLGPETQDEDFVTTLQEAVEDIAAMFGGLAEACGFKLDGGDAGTPNNLNGAFPLTYAPRPDGSFEPVVDFERAMDMIEQKRQASLTRRAAAEREAYAASTKRALELFAQMQQKAPTTAPSAS